MSVLGNRTGLGKDDVCSAGVLEEKHIEETSKMLSMLKCHNPGRTRLLRKNLAKAAISKDRIFPASDCWILVFILLFHPSHTYFVSSQLLPLQEGGERSSTPLLHRHSLTGQALMCVTLP